MQKVKVHYTQTRLIYYTLANSALQLDLYDLLGYLRIPYWFIDCQIYSEKHYPQIIQILYFLKIFTVLSSLIRYFYNIRANFKFITMLYSDFQLSI